MSAKAIPVASRDDSRDRTCQKALAVAVYGWVCLVAPACPAISMAGRDQAQAVRTASGNDAKDSEWTSYVEVDLDNRTKMAALKPGDVLTGRLSRDVYSGDRELFPAGRPVHLRVGNLERRKRTPNDYWPGVVRLFTSRHENYPTFDMATVCLSEGREVPMRVSLVSIIRKSELHAKTETLHRGAISNIPKRKGSTPRQTVILEASGLTPEIVGILSAGRPELGSAAQSAPSAIEMGTRAQVVLLRGLSASKEHPGDSFFARLVEPVRVGSRIVLPEGAILQGRVLKATPPRWLSRPGSLNLTFTAISMAQGEQVAPISAAIAGAEVDAGSHTRLDAEGGLSGGRPGKAWMLINMGLTAGIAKETDDGIQLLVEALVSTATDVSTAGVSRIAAACTSGIFLVTRHGRDVVLPRFTEMDITFNRPSLLSQPSLSSGAQSPNSRDEADRTNSK